MAQKVMDTTDTALDRIWNNRKHDMCMLSVAHFALHSLGNCLVLGCWNHDWMLALLNRGSLVVSSLICAQRPLH